MRFDKILLKYLLTVAFILLFLFAVKAQNYQYPEVFSSHWQVTFHGGASLFFGDVKQNIFWPTTYYENEWRLAGGLNLEYQISPAFAIGLQGLYGNLSGTKRKWGVYFDNDYFETNLVTNINFNSLFGTPRVNRFFSVYGVLGIGLMQYNTRVKDLESGLVFKTSGEGAGKGIDGRTLQGILIYGLGFNFRLNDIWAIHLESANRIINTDLLDGHASGYPYDVYNYTSVGIVYKFGFRKKRYILAGTKPREMTYVAPLSLPLDMDTAAMEKDVPEVSFEEQAKPVVLSEESAVNGVVEHHHGAGLNYRVQILARFTVPLSVDYISHVFKIPASEIKAETFEGHFIYTVNSYKTYNEAKIKRDEIRNYFGVTDAFVVAFENGKRLGQLPDIN